MSTLRRIKPDVIHTHTAKAGVIGRLTALIAAPKAKRVHTFHGHLLHGYFSKWKTKVVIFIEKMLAYITNTILTVGNKVKDDLLNAGIGKETKMKVTFPGLLVESSTNPLEIRKSLNLSKDEIILIFVGRLTHIKRPDRLINAYRMASNLTLNMTLLIVGDGELKSDCEVQSVGLNIRFLG